jgi:hypothetical protein
MAVLSTPGIDDGWQKELAGLGVELTQITLDDGLPRLAPEESFSQRFPGFVPAERRGPAKLVGAEIVGPEVGLEPAPEPPVKVPKLVEDAPAVQAPETAEDAGDVQEDATPVLALQRPFHPQRIELAAAHRAGSLRVFVEGEHQEQAELNPLGGAAGPRLYEIDGVSIAHGALLRVAFEPEPESP